MSVEYPNRSTPRRNLGRLLGSLSCLGLAAFVPGASALPRQPSSTAALRYWPQWRGPLRNGTAPHADPPLTWSEASNIRWKVKIPGRGTATPVAWEYLVFIQTAVPVPAQPAPAPEPAIPPPATGARSGNQPQRGPRGGGFGGMQTAPPTEVYRFMLLCLDRRTGKTLWQRVAREEVPHEGHHPEHGFASHSPVTDGRHVFAYFGSRGLHCYDLRGKVKWRKDLGRMQTKMSFGEGSSPTLFGNTIIVNWDHEGEDFIVALDKATGKERWRQPREEDTAWATPLVVQHGGRAQVVTAATRKIRSYDAATGKLLWECAGLTSNPIPSPVAANGMVYAASGFGGSALLAIRLGREGDLTGSDAIAWSHNRNTPYVPSLLLYGDRLYFFSSNSGILSCFDARSGQPLIDAQRIEALVGVYASPVGAAGKVYLVGRNGATVVLKDADALEVLATNRLEERFDASPVVVGKDLLLRGREYLYCIAEKQPARR